MTIKLFETAPAQLEFTAAVVDCLPAKGGYEVALDATAFFPEGGGQPCDKGALNGQPVLGVHLREDTIYHTVAQPVEVGSTVSGSVDAAVRLDHSQQHTGEHVLSGTLHKLFGAENVGFHIGDPYVRMDIDLPLTDAQLAQAEAQANAVVQRNVPVRAWYPDEATLAATEYRSKKALEGAVRLVEIPGADCCACCGTHLERTGGVGMIKIVSAQSYKGGVRLAVACGGRAYALLKAEHDQIVALSGLLSAKPELVLEAAQRLHAENQNLKAGRAALTTRLIEAEAATAQPGKVEIRLCDGFDPDGLRRLCTAISQKSGALCALFAPGNQGLSYALALPGQDVRPVAKELNQAFKGRGGGSDKLCQGSLTVTNFNDIKKYFEEV